MRFERDIGRRATRLLASLFQRNGFGMLDLIEEIKTFAGNLLIRIDDDCPNQRTGADLSNATRSQFQRALHHLTINLRTISHVESAIAAERRDVYRTAHPKMLKRSGGARCSKKKEKNALSYKHLVPTARKLTQLKRLLTYVSGSKTTRSSTFSPMPA